MNHRKMGFAGSAVAAALFLASTIASAGVDGRVASPQRAECEELIVNGGFENSHTGWTEYSKLQFKLLDSFFPHTDEMGAWLGAANNAEDHLTQAVMLPSDARLTLSYWWAVFSEEAPGRAFDTARTELLRADGSVITTTMTIDNESAEAWVWNEATADITAYAGETVQLRLKAVNDATNPSSFFYDDISLIACPDDGALTPTPTVTPIISLTATARSRLFLPTLLR